MAPNNESCARRLALYSFVLKYSEGTHLSKTNDWAVIYFDDGNGEQKCTVVTEHKDELVGKRVVRGRE